MARVPAAARKRALAVLALLTLALLSGWEWYLRETPARAQPVSFVQSAVNRIREPAENSDRRVILLGSSRVFFAVSPEILRRQLGRSLEVRMAAIPGGSGPAQLHASLEWFAEGDIVLVECLAIAAYTNFRSHWQAKFEGQIGSAGMGRLEPDVMGPVRAGFHFARGTSSPGEEVRRYLKGDLTGNPTTEGDPRPPEGTIIHDDGWYECASTFRPDLADHIVEYMREVTGEDRAEHMDGVIELLRRDIQKLESRGVTVVLLRLPGEGIVLHEEERLFPRDQYWQRFARELPDRAWHFADFQVTHDLKTWDGQHLTADSARIYSRWLGARLRGLLEEDWR